MVSTTSQVFLGMTLGCARCHNHKFEPLTAKDYYSMVAIFNGLQRPKKGRSELDLPIGTASQVRARTSGTGRSERWRKRTTMSASRSAGSASRLCAGDQRLTPGYYFDEPIRKRLRPIC